jgi:ferredoxin
MAASEPRVRIDPRLCEGHALCIDLAPEVFDLSDDDVATCDERPSKSLWDAVTAAMNACPRGAITIEPAQPAPTHDRSERTTA